MNVFVTSASEVMLSAMSVGLFVCLFVLGGLSLLVVGVFVTHTHTHKKNKKTLSIFSTKLGSGPRTEPG